MFLWGYISWTALSWHTPLGFKNEAAVAEVLKANAPEKGVYTLPGPLHADGSKRSDEEWMKLTNQGPMMQAMIRTGQSQRPMISLILAGLVYHILMALVLGIILMRVPLGYSCLVKMSGMIGVFAALIGWIPAMNWFEYPFSHWGPYLADYVIQGLLAGAILGKFLVKKGAS